MKENHVMAVWDFSHKDDNFIPLGDKGYPEIFNDPTFILIWSDISHNPIGYCCYKDMGHYILVGNIYVHPYYRKQGYFNSLRKFRTRLVQSLGKPAIGIIQPLNGIDPNRLIQNITHKDTDIVKGYNDISHIISEEIYELINSHILVKYRKVTNAEK